MAKKSKKIISNLTRLAAGLFLIVLIWSCASVPGLKDESIASHIRLPFVRVLLEDNSREIIVGAKGSYAIECLTGKEQKVFYSSQPVELLNRADRIRVNNTSGDMIIQGMNEVNIIPRERGARVRIGDKTYRGIMKIIPHGENLRLVNIIYIEDYLRGVVPPEIGPRQREEFEAVKAQAIAARTYTMAHMRQYGKEPFDVKSTVIDQVYQGVGAEVAMVNQAIDSTSGSVLMSDNKFINAYYHSTCGGMTDDITDVWDRKETSYLKPVVDSACSWSKYFNWNERFTEEQLRRRLEQYLTGERGRDIRLTQIRDITVVGRTAGGRVQKMIIHTADDNFSFYKDRIRWVIGRSSNPELILPSDRFEVKISRDNSGDVYSINFEGSGYGHGVGMCQCGAIGKARRGWQSNEILTYFYKDVSIKKLY
ncbi:MAG: SpoIID/LytB domain-containing protein [candidate division Zixibacteria bacterium]